MNQDEQRTQLIQHILLQGEVLAAFPDEPSAPSASDVVRVKLAECFGVMAGSGTKLDAMAARIAQILLIPWIAAGDVPPLETSDLKQAFDASRRHGEGWGEKSLLTWLTHASSAAAEELLHEGVPPHFRETWNLHHALAGSTALLVSLGDEPWQNLHRLLPVLCTADPGPSKWLEANAAPAHAIVAAAIKSGSIIELSDDEWSQVLKRLWQERSALEALEEALSVFDGQRLVALESWIERARAVLANRAPTSGPADYFAP